jgi:hypothetical protein
VRYGTDKPTTKFDLSDVDPIDRLDDVLDVAAEVLLEHGPDHGNTRIERLARWVAYNVGEVPSLSRCAELAREHGATVMTTLDQGRVYVTAQRARAMTPVDARFFAAQILRAAARAEE